MKSAEIHIALERHYNQQSGVAYIREFRAGTGFSHDAQRYLDAWVIECYPSSGMAKTAIEIKTSRSDFCREIKNPFKRDPALRISNYFYFAAPKGLLSVKDIPEETGLLEIDESGAVSVAEEAPYRETQIPSWVFVASLARRVAAQRPTDGEGAAKV